MIKETEYWENQEGFDPDALRQAFQEYLEMWAEEYGLEKKIEEGECSYIQGNDVIGARVHDLDTLIALYFPKAIIGDHFTSITYLLRDNDGRLLFYFTKMTSQMGDAGLQKALKLRKQIEKRIKEIEQEQLEAEWTDRTK